MFSSTSLLEGMDHDAGGGGNDMAVASRRALGPALGLPWAGLGAADKVIITGVQESAIKARIKSQSA